MKTQRFDFSWKPLNINANLVIVSSVPDKQEYDAVTGFYTPDYTVVQLTILPVVTANDKDDVIKGNINGSLTNIKWSEIIEGKKTTIDVSDTRYSITLNKSSRNGQIAVNHNFMPQTATTLMFEADYYDNRLGQTHHIVKTHLIRCVQGSDLVRVELDSGKQVLYNPLTDAQFQTVTSKVWLGSRAYTASQNQWQVYDAASGGWRNVETGDYDVTTDGSKATIDRKAMGDELMLRLLVSIDGKDVDNNSPSAMVSFVRRIPKFDYDIIGIPYNIPPNTKNITPESIIYDHSGVIPNANDELKSVWTFKNNSDNNNYTTIDDDKSPTIPTKVIDNTKGASLSLEIVDRGGWLGVSDIDGSVIVDTDGLAIIFR